MNNLLLPTDFSETAGEALKVAVALANRFEAELHLFHLLELSGDDSAAAKAHETLEGIRRANPDIRITAALEPGHNLQTALPAYAGRHGVDLIVIGSHGASGKSEYFIGSNTQKVVRTVRCPVLVIKKAPPEIRFQKVAFASSFNLEEREAFARFLDFVRPFLPEIHLVAVHTSSLFDPPYTITQEAMNDFKARCHPFPCHTHIYKDLTVERGIRTFAREIGAELIGISNHHRHPLRRMLAGSNVEALVNHAEAPVLTIDFEGHGS